MPGTRNIALCLAGDHAGKRYGEISLFGKRLADALEAIVGSSEDIRLVFVPHVHCDLELIVQVFAHLTDKTRRLRTQIAPLLHQNSAAQFIYTIYNKCDLIVSNRFHGVVVPLSMGKNVIAFCDKITKKVPSVVAKLGQQNVIFSHKDDDLKGFVEKVSNILYCGCSTSSHSHTKDGLHDHLMETNQVFLDEIESILPKL